MQPSGDLLGRLLALLLDAFTYPDLRLLVRTRLEAELEQIVPIIDRNLTQISYSLIRHYAAQPDGLLLLTQAAQAERPARPDLPGLLAEVAAVTWDPLPLPDPTPAPSLLIDTGGGMVVQGNVSAGRDFIGRDQVNITQVLAAPPPALYINVPPLPTHFVGRESLLIELVDRLVGGQSAALAANGLAGVGKTTLAVALARHPRVLAHFADGILWAGLGPNADVASIQASWAAALGVEIRDLLDPYARQQRLNNQMGQRRLLLVLDDAWAWEPLAQLRSSGPQICHLLTTRDQSLARRFAGAGQGVSVPPLASVSGYRLLQQLAPEACASDPQAAQQLAARVDGLPLALELLGGYLGASNQRRTQARRQQALTRLHDPAARLTLATARLGDPTRQTVSLQTTIQLSLADLPPTTVAAFYALGAFAAKPARFDLPAALAVTGAEEEQIFTLADRNLVELAADETLSLHQTLADLARTQTPPEVVTRHRDHYLALVEEAREDWQRIEAIYAQIGFAWQQLPAHPALDDLLPLVWALGVFQERRGLWSDYLAWAGQALTLARAVGRERDEAVLLNNLGVVYRRLGDIEKALKYLSQALALYKQVGNKEGEANTLNNLGHVYSFLREKQKAVQYLSQALPLYRQTGNKEGEANTLNNLGTVYDDLGEKQQSLEYYNQALPLYRQIRNKEGEATTLNNLGALYDDLSEKQKAIDYYNQALPLLQQLGNKGGEATILNNLARMAYQAGQIEQAMTYLRQVIQVFHDLGAAAEEAAVMSNLALLLRLSGGDLTEAKHLMESSIGLLKHYELSQDAMGETLIRKTAFLADLAV